MDDYLDDEMWGWDEEDLEDLVYKWASDLADRFFLSDEDFTPEEMEYYHLGHVEAEEWVPLVQQLDEILDLESLLSVVESLDAVLDLPGLPTGLLENPRGFLLGVLDGHLPREASGRRVGSRKLVKIARMGLDLLFAVPEPAQAAVRAWADLQRQWAYGPARGDEDLFDLLVDPDQPPAMIGFSMAIALTLMHWPERAEGLPLPDGFDDPEFFEQVLAQWEALPASPVSTDEEPSSAEALFAQGQLAHLLAQMGAVDLMGTDNAAETDLALAYSRLSRAILWIHNECRHCPERADVACKAATSWSDRPAPLLDIVGELANTGRIGGCVNM